MLPQDSLEIAKKVVLDPLPYVNGAVFLGMTAADWDLGMKIIIGLGSIVWTWWKVYHEWKKYQETQSKKCDCPQIEEK